MTLSLSQWPGKAGCAGMTYYSFVKPCSRGLFLASWVMVFFIALTAISPRALACGICDPMTNEAEDAILEPFITQQHTDTRQIINDHTDRAFEAYEQWLVDDYFKQYILPAMAMMAEQMSAVAMQQMEILGTFLDAKHQLETERLFQQLAAQAHKDYQPSEGMCTIGTVARSLAAADRNGEMNALVLSRRSQERQLMSINSSATEGRKSDRKSQAEQFKNTYCDPNDDNRGLTNVCTGNVTDARKDKDVDFTRTLWSPMSLNINLSNGALTDDETDVMALQSNLYAHALFEKPVSSEFLRDNPGNQQVFMNMRSIIAKRSVAENSFEALAAMKSQGTTAAADTGKYLQAVIQQLSPDIKDADAKSLIGDNPSYYAQMEVLTKKLLEDPQFFTDLYDKPANVARKGVALQAISLMQDRDYFKSNLRSEAILSVLLEMEVANAQKKVQDEIDRLTGKK